MSASCATYRALLGRWVERETTPEEALQLARHVPDCTACRIVLSREIRLARMLEGLADSIAVEEGFLRTVMRSLPAGPPPAGRSRRGLKLAGLGCALLLTGIGAARLAELLAGARRLNSSRGLPCPARRTCSRPWAESRVPCGPSSIG